MTKKFPLYIRILLGMLAGAVVGVFAVAANLNWFITDWVKPFGVIFLNLLKLVAMPLIFASLVTGISGLSDITKLSRIGIKTISLYLITTVLAISIGLVLVNIIKPGNSFPEEKRTELLVKYSTDVEGQKVAVENLKNGGPLQFLIDLVPENVVEAASNNQNMLQIIFFAVLFGLAIVLIKNSKVEVVRNFVEGLNDIILKVIDLIMLFAPVGVFALIAALVTDFSGNNIYNSLYLFGTLGLYAIVVVLGLLLVAFVIYPIFLKFFAGIKVGKFYKAMFPAQLVAF